MKNRKVLVEKSTRKFLPTLLAAAILVPILSVWAESPRPAVKSSRPPKQGRTKTKPLPSVDSLKGVASKPLPPGPKPDSLVGLRDSSRRVIDSLQLSIDTLQRIGDSLQVVADSLRRADSTQAAQRAWYLAIPQPPFLSTRFLAPFQERLAVEIRRSGRVQIRGKIEPGMSWDSIWAGAKASGAGKILFVSMGVDSLGRVGSTASLFDLTNGQPIDSAQGNSPDTTIAQAKALAHHLASWLLPSPQDSACRVDSLDQAASLWSISLAPSDIKDTLAARLVRDSVMAFMGRSPWVSPKSQAVPEGCTSLGCEDSLGRVLGATLVLRAHLARQPDSAWTLSARLVRLADSQTVDSLLVTDTAVGLLASRLVPPLLRPPPTCGESCLPVVSREVWTEYVASDSSFRKASSLLESLVGKAFRNRKDRQYLSLPKSVTPIRFDSVSRSVGATRRMAARLSGSDSLWVLAVSVQNFVEHRTDTLTLKRGGPSSRVFPWFARHLAALEGRDQLCQSVCRTDSLRRAATTWAVVPGPDSTAKAMASALAKAFLVHGPGRMETLPDSLASNNLPGLDSLCASRGIQKTVWPTFTRGSDSSWAWKANIADMESDVVADSVSIRDSGISPAAFARLSKRFWQTANPVVICDSCRDTDTLEAALVLPLPARWNGGPDSLRQGFRDSLARILSKEGLYQILDTGTFTGLVGDSSSYPHLRCKTGAAFVLQNEVVLEKEGWHVRASLVEITSGRVVASLDYQDKSRRADRPAELAGWVARRLLGTETRTVAPPHPWNLPWMKIAKLGIPATIGILSVLLHL